MPKYRIPKIFYDYFLHNSPRHHCSDVLSVLRLNDRGGLVRQDHPGQSAALALIRVVTQIRGVVRDVAHVLLVVA